MFKNILLTTAIVSFAVPAIAGGMSEPVMTAPAAAPVAAAPVQTAADWTGFYAGAQLFDWSLGTSFEGSDFFTDTGYGIHAGYNYDFGDFVVGAEIDYDMVTLSNDELLEDIDATTTRLKLRGGYDFGSLMAYGVVGAGIFGDGDSDTDDERVTTLGVGASYLATEHIVVGAEFLRDTFSVDDVDVEMDTLSLRASYKF